MTAAKGAASSSAEGEPWRSLSFILFTLQFMVVTLDLFMDTLVEPGWHYAITSVEFVVALFLSALQTVRMRRLFRRGYATSPFQLAVLALSTSLCIQLFAAGVAAYWFDIANDRDSYALEWALFAVSIVWGVVNPATYAAVAALEVDHCEEDGSGGDSSEGGAKKKKRMAPSAAAANVFAKHFSRTPVLFFFGALFASAHAILTTFQGSVINDLTKAVTKVDPKSGTLEATASDVSMLGWMLVGVWFATNLSRFIFDLISATMFSRLEIWLRGAVFEQALAWSSDPSGGSNLGSKNKDSASEFQARYASDVSGVVSLYGTLLRGVVVNILLIITNFAFLAIYEWRVATVTLAFLAMGVTSGPTDLAGNAAASVQKNATAGLGELGDVMRNSPTIQTTPGLEKHLAEKHQTEVMAPLKVALWRQIFFSSSVDTYINFFSSFLTVIVVITMSWQVFMGEMDSSDFLSIFFVFKQLQKPALKISSVIKSAVKRSANLERLNEVLFPPNDGTEKDPKDNDMETEKNLSSANSDNTHSTVSESQVSLPSPVMAFSKVSGGRISDLTICLGEGECVCFSGSRREDAVNLASGILKADGGRITIREKEASSRAEIVEAVATVFSSPALLSGSVRWNIAAGRPDASPEEVSSALRRAGVSEADVDKLPKGLDSDIGEAKDAWSDALLIRLSVARSLLRNPLPCSWALPNFGVGGNLDNQEWEELLLLLRGIIKDNGGAIVITTADPNLQGMADRVVAVGVDGKIDPV